MKYSLREWIIWSVLFGYSLGSTIAAWKKHIELQHAKHLMMFAAAELRCKPRDTTWSKILSERLDDAAR